MLSIIQKKNFTLILNIFVGLFFSTVLISKKGYSYVPIFLGGVGIIYALFYLFKFKAKWQLKKSDKVFILSLVFYFCTFLLSILIKKDNLRELDNPSRVLLFIPLLLLFSQFPIKIKTILYAIPIGAMVTGLLALFQKFYLGFPKPFPEIMRIQSGDISISLATLSIVITIYWAIKKEYKLALFSLFAVFLAMSASALSGARGGWIGLPIVIVSILFFYRKYISKKIILGIVSIISIALLSLISIPKFGVMQRYQAAKNDIVYYIEKDNKQTSLGARFDMWLNGLIAIKEAPVFGHGSKGYDIFREKQIQNNQMQKSTKGFNSLHNQYLESWVKRGLVGFLGLLLVMFTPLIFFIRKLSTPNLENKCIAILGIIHVISHLFYFTSQSFLAHNSGSIFYFFVSVIFFALLVNKE